MKGISVFNATVWGAQAASLFVSAACRDVGVAGKLPATAGWQAALPATEEKARNPRNSGFGGV